MNDSISWDPSLIKKFSSSNHYKLLNQLKNEVKKYPLNNKKKTSSFQNKVNNQVSNSKSDINKAQNNSLIGNSNQNNEETTIKSTVSFNNAKNFSIYKQTSNNNISRTNESFLSDQDKLKEDSPSPTFIERLNQIDMK